MWYTIVLLLSVWGNCWALMEVPDIDMSQKNLLVKNEIGELYCNKNNPRHLYLSIFQEGEISYHSFNSFRDIDTSSFSKFTLKKIDEAIKICAIARTKESIYDAFLWEFSHTSRVNCIVSRRMASNLPNNATLVVPLSDTLCAVYAQTSGNDSLIGYIDGTKWYTEAYQKISEQESENHN